VTVSIAGGTVGVLFAIFAIASIKAVLAWVPKGTFPVEADVHLNFPVLVFSAAGAVTTGILSGVFPAFRFSSS